MRACSNPSCKGYLSRKFRCVLCQTEYCSTCLMPKKSKRHKCAAADLKSVEYIQETSKNCPSCDALVYKSSGCDMCFCYHCETPFSWHLNAPLNIQHWDVHSPDFRDWRHQYPEKVHREPQTLSLYFKGIIHNKHTENATKIFRHEKLVKHLLNLFEDGKTLYEKYQDQLHKARLEYYSKDTPENRLKTRLFDIRQSYEFGIEINRALTKYNNDLYNCFHDLCVRIDVPTAFVRMDRYRDEFNEKCRQISVKFNYCRVPYIDKTLLSTSGQVCAKQRLYKKSDDYLVPYTRLKRKRSARSGICSSSRSAIHSTSD
jgi:hypothetical protein